MPSALRATFLGVWVLLGLIQPRDAGAIDYRLLATNRTSTMEAEMNRAAGDGYRLAHVMGGHTAFGGQETVVAMSRSEESDPSRFRYKLLATSRTSTMQEELDAAAHAYVGQTVFETTFGGEEIVVILEQQPDLARRSYEYLLLATRRTSTLESELQEAAEQGFVLRGLTVGETRFGGREVLAILSRPASGSGED